MARGFTSVSADMLRRSLAQKLIPVVDGVRDLVTRLGLRPYAIRLVWTRWSEGVRGEGCEIVVKSTDLLPAPASPSLLELASTLTAGGEEEQGAVRVSEISGRYSENFLKGYDESGNPPEPDVHFYWEVEFPLAGAGSVKRRFAVRGVPFYDAGKLQWIVDLERTHVDGAGSGGEIL